MKAGTGEAGMPRGGENDSDSIQDDTSRRTISSIQRWNRRGKSAKKESGMKETKIEIDNLI